MLCMHLPSLTLCLLAGKLIRFFCSPNYVPISLDLRGSSVQLHLAFDCLIYWFIAFIAKCPRLCSEAAYNVMLRHRAISCGSFVSQLIWLSFNDSTHPVKWHFLKDTYEKSSLDKLFVGHGWSNVNGDIWKQQSLFLWEATGDRPSPDAALVAALLICLVLSQHNLFCVCGQVQPRLWPSFGSISCSHFQAILAKQSFGRWWAVHWRQLVCLIDGWLALG